MRSTFLRSINFLDHLYLYWTSASSDDCGDFEIHKKQLPFRVHLLPPQEALCCIGAVSHRDVKVTGMSLPEQTWHTAGLACSFLSPPVCLGAQCLVGAECRQTKSYLPLFSNWLLYCGFKSSLALMTVPVGGWLRR